MKGSLQLIHHLPGRLRVRMAPLRGNARIAELVEQRILEVPGVRSVTASPVTGSVLILYDSLQTSSQLICAMLDAQPAPHCPVRPVRRVAVHPHRRKRVVMDRVAPWLAQKVLEIALERTFILLVAAIL